MDVPISKNNRSAIIESHFIIVLLFSVVVAIFLTAVLYKGINAQSIETLTGQSKVANPQIKVGGDAREIVINEDMNKIYVYNPTNGTVSVIDSNLGHSVKDIRVGNYSSAAGDDYSQYAGSSSMVVDYLDHRIYVAIADSNIVSVLDGNNDTVIGEIKVGRDPHSIAIDTFLHKIYVLSKDAVSIINGSNFKNEPRNILTGEISKLLPGEIKYSPVSNLIYISNRDFVSVIDPETDKEIQRVKVGYGAGHIFVQSIKSNDEIQYFGFNNTPSHDSPFLTKIYVTSQHDNAVSVINGSTSTKIKSIFVRDNGGIMSNAGDEKIYVASQFNNGISVINFNKNINEQNITLGPHVSIYGIDGDHYSHKVYVTHLDSNAVSVIDSSNPIIRDKQELHNLTVGLNPGPVSSNSQTHMIYVGNTGSHSVSVINGFTSKVAAGVTFNVNPVNSGTVVCGNKEYPTNVYIYVDNGTSCAGKPRNNFEFDGWVENLPSEHNLTMPMSDSSGNLSVNKYGTFTADFKPLPPVIPPEYLAPLYGIIASSIIGWSIPNIIGWGKTKTQRNNLKECISQIGKLDKSAIEEKIIKYYIDGKISESQHKLLEDKIAEYYENS